jgi:hypothetical protein
MPELFIDDDGYVAFTDKAGFSGVGIIWSLHRNGWEAFINAPGNDEPIYSTNEVTFPTDDDQANAALEYEKLGGIQGVAGDVQENS